jgi:hypothetical protein
MYTEPNLAQPANPLSAKPLGPASFFYDPSHASDGFYFSCNGKFSFIRQLKSCVFKFGTMLTA